MYTSFFGLQEKPFAITPDPRYLYLSERHAEALAHLEQSVSAWEPFKELAAGDDDFASLRDKPEFQQLLA